VTDNNDEDVVGESHLKKVGASTKVSYKGDNSLNYGEDETIEIPVKKVRKGVITTGKGAHMVEFPSDIFDDEVSDIEEDADIQAEDNDDEDNDDEDNEDEDNEDEDIDEYSEGGEYVTPVKRRDIPVIRVPKKGGGMMQIPKTSTPEMDHARTIPGSTIKEKRLRVKSGRIQTIRHEENAGLVTRKRGRDHTGDVGRVVKRVKGDNV
jgi:hypothetical protein